MRRPAGSTADVARYSVSQVADLSGVTVRTLHHYDAIGLLKPAHVRSNGYRAYDDADLLRLQQILFYRELGFDLAAIGRILDAPDFDAAAALRTHRAALHTRITRLTELVATLDHTLALYTEGETDMGKGNKDDKGKKKLFGGFSEEKQKDYERQLRLRYGPDTVAESVRNWNSYSETEKQGIMDQGNALYAEIVRAIEDDKSPGGNRVQALMERWHQHIRHFYEPTTEVLRGLADLYTTHPDFIANFAKLHPKLGDFVKESITVYVDALEDAELRRLLADDAGRAAGG